MIVTVVGARPQFIKAAVLSQELKRRGIEEAIIHTGQHYDYKMSEVFFKELDLPGVALNLEVGSGTHGGQTADMLKGIEDFLIEKREKVDSVLLYGDTNSTVAGALAASKLQIPVIHVEAGLRSFNRAMPEEINRVVTDHLSDLLFCSSKQGVNQLKKEGITKGVHEVGDIMLDAQQIFGKIARDKLKVEELIPKPLLETGFNLMTIHRPANTDTGNLQVIIEEVGKLNHPTIWPVHPRVKNKLQSYSIPDQIKLFDPLTYFEMNVVLDHVNKVITDSGGLQKEAYWKRKPCITVRTETEWVETLHNNWNQLMEPAELGKAYESSADLETWKELYGGSSVFEIVKIILKQKKLNHG